MQPWKRTLGVLWVGVFLCSASYTMQAPFLPLYLLDLGVDRDTAELWAAIVLSSTYMVGAVMSPFWGALADKYGSRNMVIRAGFCIAVVYVLFIFVSNPWELLIVRILHGFSMGFVPACLAITAAISPPEKTGWSLGVLQAGAISGGLLGPLFGSLLTVTIGHGGSYMVGASLMFSATLAIIFGVHGDTQTISDERREKSDSTLKMILNHKLLWHLLMLVTLFQLAINMIQPLLGLYVIELLGSLKQATISSGFVFAVSGIAAVIASPLWNRFGERKSYSKVLILCLTLAGAVVALQFFVQNIWMLMIFQFLYGIFLAGIVPSINTIVVKNTAEAFRGRSFGLLNSATQVGLMIGPIISGAAALFISMNWIFVIAGILIIALGLWSWEGRGMKAGGTG